MVRFWVLGPLEVSVGDRRLSLGSLRQRTLLGALLCRPGQVVPAPALVEAVWRMPYTAGAASNLQVYVHRLRRSLGDPSRIAYRAPGYVLRADPDEIDSGRFERMAELGTRQLAAGDTADAATTLDDALRLWRGEASAG